MKFLFAKSRELAIVIDENCIRFLEVTLKKNQIFKIHKHLVIDNNLLQDSGNLDKFKFRHILKTTIKEFKIKAQTVHVVIPSSLAIVRQQIMPNLPGKELKQMVNFEIGNTIHLPFEMPVFDIVKTNSEQPADNEQGEDTCQVAIVAASGKVVYPLVEILKENKLRPKTIDIPALSLYRLFSFINPDLKDEPVLLGYLTRFGIDLHILDKGILGFTRHIPFEMGDFINEDLKNKELNDQMLLNKIQEQDNNNSFFAALSHEIERAIDFYQYTLNNRDRKIQGCYLASNIDFSDQFYQYLQDRVDIELSPLYYQRDDLTEEEAKQYKGFEVGLGMFFRKAGDKDGD